MKLLLVLEWRNFLGEKRKDGLPSKKGQGGLNPRLNSIGKQVFGGLVFGIACTIHGRITKRRNYTVHTTNNDNKAAHATIYSQLDAQLRWLVRKSFVLYMFSKRNQLVAGLPFHSPLQTPQGQYDAVGKQTANGTIGLIYRALGICRIPPTFLVSNETTLLWHLHEEAWR